MTRKDIEQALLHLNQLVLAGQPMEAFEKYYDDEVVMQENQLPPTVSKAANRDREKAFYDNVTEFRSAAVKGIAIGDGISYVTWHYDYTHKEWGNKNYEQVSVQKWRDGKIVEEQFFYGG